MTIFEKNMFAWLPKLQYNLISDFAEQPEKKLYISKFRALFSQLIGPE